MFESVLSNFRASCSSSRASRDGSCETVRKESPKACLNCCISRPAFVLLNTYCWRRLISWFSCSLNKVICQKHQQLCIFQLAINKKISLNGDSSVCCHDFALVELGVILTKRRERLPDFFRQKNTSVNLKR